jgi:hypothetical protein
MTEKAVIDRFEGDSAIILIAEKPIVIPRASLPKGVKEGDWLQVEMEEGNFISAKLDPMETKLATERIAEKLNRLRSGEHKI